MTDNTFQDSVFNVIIAKNSLHFVSNIPKLYDDIKFLLRSHGIFVKISNPLFDLGMNHIFRAQGRAYRLLLVFSLQRGLPKVVPGQL